MEFDGFQWEELHEKTEFDEKSWRLSDTNSQQMER